MDEMAPAGEGTGTGMLEETKDRMLGVLERLEGAWLERALNADQVATQMLLEIEKQRAAVRIAAGASAGKGEGGGGEVKVVVEYVQDWREARRQRGEG